MSEAFEYYDPDVAVEITVGDGECSLNIQMEGDLSSIDLTILPHDLEDFYELLTGAAAELQAELARQEMERMRYG